MYRPYRTLTVAGGCDPDCSRIQRTFLLKTPPIIDLPLVFPEESEQAAPTSRPVATEKVVDTSAKYAYGIGVNEHALHIPSR